jgi:hypothetical protein
MLLFTICSKTTDEVNSFIGNGLDYLVVGITEDNETVRHNVALTPTANGIQSGGEQSSSLPLNDTVDTSGSFVVDSGKLVVSVTYRTEL